MKENKNLDKLFQEKFKSLHYQPQEIVWKNIEEQLKEKKKKRVIPFWWKLSGIAAVLVLGLGLYNVVDNNSSTKSVVDSNNNSINSTNSSNNKNDSNDRVIKNYNDAIVLDEESSKNNDSQVKISEEEKDNTLKNNVLKSKRTNLGIASSNKNKNKSSDKTNNNKAIVNNYELEKSKYELENDSYYSNDTKNNSSTIVNNQFENNTKISNNFNNDKTIVNNKIEDKITSNENNKEITKNIEEIKKIDTTSIASVVPNAMEELLIEKEKKTSKEPKLNRWQLSSNVAPIYFSSSSNGSPLDSKFKENTKQFNTNVGYGIGVKYALNKKIKIRTGVNSLIADYNTNEVVVYQNANASKIEHVDSNLRGSIIQIENKSLETLPTLEANGGLLKKYDSSLNQKIGYIEVPLELSYKIVDKKFGIEVIGGVSSLFLNQNEVSVITSGTELTIGKANNLNSFHFSGNLGLGLKYNLWKKIEAHVEPIFKYQVNTFNNDSGNFKPYIFGVYSGLSYTF